jgi:hypothetical protein
MKRREYVVIPVEIWENEDLTKSEMLLYAEIDSFSRYGECFASNEHFAKYLRVSKDRISKLLTSLRRKGFIKIDLIYKKGTKEIEKRIIKPVSVKDLGHGRSDREGIGEMDTPSRSSDQDPLVESAVYPIGENAYENNTNNINKQINNTKNKKNISVLPNLEAEFEEFWKQYPKRSNNSKKTAKEKFLQARKKKKIPYETIINGLYQYKAYLEATDSEEQYIAHASTWLNQERWENDYLIVQKKKKMKNFMDLLEPEFGGNEHYGNAGNAQIIDHDSSVLPYP